MGAVYSSDGEPFRAFRDIQEPAVARMSWVRYHWSTTVSEIVPNN